MGPCRGVDAAETHSFEGEEVVRNLEDHEELAHREFPEEPLPHANQEGTK
jgi:hypothetical protein